MFLKLLEDAYAIIDGIPEKRLKLNRWQVPSMRHVVRSASEIECGTLACAAGWLALHPDMQRRGLVPSDDGGPSFMGKRDYIALAKFFRITESDAHYLFRPRYAEVAYREDHLSDKELWLHRARNLIYRYRECSIRLAE